MTAILLKNISLATASQGSVVGANVRYKDETEPAFDKIYRDITGFTTTYGAGDQLTYGVTLQDIKPGAKGPVAMPGSLVSKVLCNSAVARGDYLFPSTTVAFYADVRAQANGVPPNCFGIATAADASSPFTPSALLLPLRAGISLIKNTTLWTPTNTQQGRGRWDNTNKVLYIGQSNSDTANNYLSSASSGGILPSSIDHTVYAQWFDDFMGDAIDDRWASSVNGTGGVSLVFSGTTYLDGIVRVQASAADGHYTLMYDGETALDPTATAGIIFDCEAFLGAADNSKENYFGFTDGVSLNNTVMMGWNSADHVTNFVAKWRSSGGSWNTQSLGVAADTARHQFKITVAPNSAIFALDGATSGNGYYAATTSIPTALMSAMVWAKFNSGASGTVNIYVDYIAMLQGRA